MRCQSFAHIPEIFLPIFEVFIALASETVSCGATFLRGRLQNHAILNKPFETETLLSNFKVSIGMDFSMTNEMTRPQKMYASFLNKLWVAWLQSRGYNVIPNVSFPDEWEEDYWLEGWPKHSIIAISSVGVTHHGNPEEWLKAVKRVREELQTDLHPSL